MSFVNLRTRVFSGWMGALRTRFSSRSRTTPIRMSGTPRQRPSRLRNSRLCPEGVFQDSVALALELDLLEAPGGLLARLFVFQLDGEFEGALEGGGSAGNIAAVFEGQAERQVGSPRRPRAR